MTAGPLSYGESDYILVKYCTILVFAIVSPILIDRVNIGVEVLLFTLSFFSLISVAFGYIFINDKNTSPTSN